MRLIRGLAPACKGLCCYVEGTGFVAATKRSVMAMVTMATGSAFPIRVVGDAAEGAAWSLEVLGRAAPAGVSAADVVAAAERYRTEHAPRAFGGRGAGARATGSADTRKA